jgi:hypothetical protein
MIPSYIKNTNTVDKHTSMAYRRLSAALLSIAFHAVDTVIVTYSIVEECLTNDIRLIRVNV